MSNISELANVPQISFIENMTLQETEEQLKAEYARIYREQTGKELVLGEADAKTLLLKAFALIEYQTIEAAVKELDLAEKNAIGEIGKIFSDAEQTPQN